MAAAAAVSPVSPSYVSGQSPAIQAPSPQPEMLFQQTFSLLNLLIPELNKKLNITHMDLASERVLPAIIFGMENLVREKLKLDSPEEETLDFPEKKQYEQIYGQTISLLNDAKKQIQKHPYHRISPGAAEDGKAAMARGELLIQLCLNNRPIKKNQNSKHMVMVHGGAVAKRSSPIATYEERTANQLINLLSKTGRAVVGAVELVQGSTKDLAIPGLQKKLAGAVRPETLEKATLDEIKKKLSPIENVLLERYCARPPPPDRNLRWRDWILQDPREPFPDLIPISSDDLYSFLKNGPWNQEVVLYSVQQGVSSPRLTRIDVDDSFISKITAAYEYTKAPSPDLFLIPQADSGWKVMTQEVLEDCEAKELRSFGKCRVKPNISDMFNFSTIRRMFEKPQHSNRFVERLLNQLGADGILKAMLMGEVGLLDLYAANIGIALSDHPAKKHYQELTFKRILETDELTFQFLWLRYLNEEINDDTVLQFRMDKRLITKPLGQLPELKEILENSLDLVIFDTDMSLSESNLLQSMELGKKSSKDDRTELKFYTPIRSFFLETKWKDMSLPKEVIDSLLDPEREKRLRYWVDKKDAPIYQRLKPEARDRIIEALTPCIAPFEFSHMRYQVGNPPYDDLHLSNWDQVTLASLRTKFVQSMLGPKEETSEPSKFWTLLQREWDLAQGDLAKKTAAAAAAPQPFSEEQKRIIANQIFPRLSNRQKKTLYQRLANEREYLKGYGELSSKLIPEENLLEKMGEFVAKGSTPLTSAERTAFTTRLQEIKGKPPDLGTLQNLLDDILDTCVPTYFNVMKAMYPLLANNFALALTFFRGDRQRAGASIGDYHYPLEDMIVKAKKQFKQPDDPTHMLAVSLAKRIREIKFPSYTGCFFDDREDEEQG